MNTKSLKCAINCDRILTEHVIGVFPADHLPEHVKNTPCGFIVNTDPSFLPGKHWVAFFVSSAYHGEFFDSYGHEPLFYNQYFMDFFTRNNLRLTYNNTRLQSEFSNVCGQYSLLFLLYRTRQLSQVNFLESFSDNFSINDEYVSEYIQELFPYCFKSTATSNQLCQSMCKW